MNFVRSGFIAWRISKVQALFDFFLITLLSIYMIGCGDQVRLPSAGQLSEFKNAGPVRPSVDIDRLVRAKIGGGPYRIVPGDVLELAMPTILRVITAERPEASEQVTPYVCRVSERGSITLPVVGEIEAAAKSLAEIESAIIDVYYPKYAVTRPSVFARVLEYRTAKVSVTGAVEKPGVYELRSDQMSLVALLMEAGGIIDEGAALIRIIHTEETFPGDKNTSSNPKLNTSDSKWSSTSDADYYVIPGDKNTSSDGAVEKSLKIGKKAELNKNRKPEPFVLPVKGLNIPFADVALQDGDTVIVERLQLPLFTVMGLVSKPGNFPYPPDVRYNLMQALAFAGGLDQAAEPRYATVYRLKPDSTIVSAIFKVVDGSKLTDALNVPIKPGDIVDVAHTPRTRAKLFLDRVFRINLGIYVPLYLLDRYE